MAELATIARPYAEALFKALGNDAAAAGWVEELGAIAADEGLLQFAGNPKVTPDKVFDLVKGLVKTSLPQAGQNFVKTVIENGRLQAVPEIAVQFRALVNAKSGSSDAEVFSAYAIEGAALNDLKALLEKRFGRKLNVTVKLDVELIGGIRVVVGDEVLDTSVKARLEQMKAALTA